MSAPPWGHKPPAVSRVEDYWLDPPPEPSPRVPYWLRRLDEGSWHPNRHFSGQGYHSRAEWLGVYIWESNEIVGPAIRRHRDLCVECMCRSPHDSR